MSLHELWKIVQHQDQKCLLQYLSGLQSEETKTLLNSVHKKSGDNVTHLLARHGKLSMLQEVYEGWYVPLNKVNLDGKTPLHEAAATGQASCTAYLLSKGVNVNPLKRAGWTPLMMACTKRNNLKTLILLLDAGANPQLVNKDGWNCFHIACRDGDTEMLSYLVENVPQIWDTVSNNGRKPIHTAALNGRSDIVHFLINKLQTRTDVRDSCGSTPFMDAVRSGDEQTLQLIFDNNSMCCSDVNKLGHTCMHIAAEAGKSASLTFLSGKCSLSPNIEVKTEKMLLEGQTPLHFAYRENNSSAIETLLNLGADPNKKDKKGRRADEMLLRRTWPTNA